MLSTPPAFVLSQDQTLRKEMLHAGRGKPVGSEFETDKIDCLLTICLIQRNSLCPQARRVNIWHLTLCTLLSSQGSDALVHSLPGLHRGNFSIVTTSRRVSNRHTARSEAHTRPSDPAHGNLARLHDPERLFKPARQQPQLPARHPHTHHRSGVVTILAPRASAQRAHEPEQARRWSLLIRQPLGPASMG